ncbi:UNVERIFIED_ORG: glycosyltransferase involved in cell wall biosynthesis [Heyndrickxia coagulans]
MKVSVILPVYNVANYLDACMESLARQTLPAYEIIAVDDGSKDGSRKVLKKWAERLPQLKIIRQKHSGAPGGPRNKGLTLATGDYIHFLDPDDRIDHDFYESSFAWIRKHDPDIVVTNIYKFNSRQKWQVYTFKLLGLFQESRLTNLYETKNLIHNLGPANKIFKREFLTRNGLRFLEGCRFEDVHFITCCLYLAKKVFIHCDTHYHWRKRESLRNLSITQKNFMFRAVADRVRIHREIDRFLMAQGLLDHRYIKDIRAILDFTRYASNLYRYLPHARRRFFPLVNHYLQDIDERAFDYVPEPELVRARYFFLRNGMPFEFAATASVSRGYLPVTPDGCFDFRAFKGKHDFDHLLPDAVRVPPGLQPEKAELLAGDLCNRALSLKGFGQIGYLPPRSKQEAGITVILQNRTTKEERRIPAVIRLLPQRRMRFVAAVDIVLLADWLALQQTVDLFLEVKAGTLLKKLRLHADPHAKLGNYGRYGELSVTKYGNISIAPAAAEQRKRA